MFKRVLPGLVLSTLMFGAAHADQPRFEFTPFFTQRGDGGFLDASNNNVNLAGKSGMAGAFNWAASDHGSQYELLYSRQSTRTDGNQTDGSAPIDMRIEYLQLGGTTLLGDEEGHVVPFASGGIGAARFTPGVAASSAQVLSQETRWAFSLGGGVRIPVATHVRLRFEVRGYLTWLDGSSSLFCSGNTTTTSTTTVTCPLQAKGQTFFQYEALGGVSVGF